MRKIIVLLVLLLTVSAARARAADTLTLARYWQMLSKGNKFEGDSQYVSAFYKYNAAQTYARANGRLELVDTAQSRIDNLFKKIDRFMKIAESSIIAADSIRKAGRIALAASYVLELPQEAVTDGSYMLADSATADGRQYYFVDSAHRPVAHLRAWRFATDFENGYARVSNGAHATVATADTIMNGSGGLYRAVTDFTKLNPAIRVLAQAPAGTLPFLPLEISYNKQLQVLILRNKKTLRLTNQFSSFVPNLVHLDLSDCHLKELPASGFWPPALKVLYVSNNEGLSALPRLTDVANPDLEALYLSNTGIDELPDNIGDLRNLRVLDISYTRIRTLPASIGRLQHLGRLILDEKQAAKMKEELKKITCVYSLEQVALR